jgi:Flp pilus assembly protein TadB
VVIAAALLAAIALGFLAGAFVATFEWRRRAREQERDMRERERAIRIEEKLRAHEIFQNYLACVKDMERTRQEFLARPLPTPPRIPR